MYGEKRLGVIKENRFLMKKPTQNGIATPVIVTASKPLVKTSIYPLGKKHYETTDRLGNVRVTYTDKKSCQQNKFALNVSSSQDYYPFGSVMEGRKYNLTAYRYAFNTQERVPELNESHYTALYWEYDGRLARRWNVDSKLSPFVSAYAVLGDNPLWYTDVLGDTIKISYRAGFLGLGKKHTLIYENGNLLNTDRSAYTHKVKGFLKQSVDALAYINKSAEGSAMLSELQNSENVFTLEKSVENEFVPDNIYAAYANQWKTDPNSAESYAALQKKGINFSGGSGGTIYWNPNGGTSVWEVGGKPVNRPYVFLAHEMFHGLDANRGLLDSRSHLHIKVLRSEWQAVYRENILRQQMGLPLRTHYIDKRDQYGNSIGPAGPYMLTPSGDPILPDWYKP